MSVSQNSRIRSRRVAVVGAIAAAGVAVVIVGSGAASGAGAPKAGPSIGPAPSPVATPPGVPTEPPRPPEPKLSAIPHITQRGQKIAMPLAPYITSMSDLKLFDTATGLKARDCMRSLGFQSWTPNTITPGGPGTYQEFEPLDYLDPATVARSGYPQTLVDKMGKAGAHPAAAGPTPSDDGLRAFLGGAPRTRSGVAVPKGGCDGAATREVKGAVTELPVNARSLALDARTYAMGDSRMKKVFVAWSGCMARHGLHYGNPLSAQNDRRWGLRTSPTPASAVEKQVAAIDARCQNGLNLIGTFKALEIGYQKELVDADQASLKSSKAIADRWIANAKAVIGNK
jgi:hypothetical protein